MRLQVVYVGDGNNITHSWIRLAAKFNFELVCACPEGFEPDQATVDLVNNGGAGKVTISHDVYDVSCCRLSLLLAGRYWAGEVPLNDGKLRLLVTAGVRTFGVEAVWEWSKNTPGWDVVGCLGGLPSDVERDREETCNSLA